MKTEKTKIPKALREQLWLRDIGRKYEGKCKIVWCENKMTVFDFQCGHDIPESHGGETILENLVPICSRCNLSMSNTYTIKEWNLLSKPLTCWKRFLLLFKSDTKERGIPLSPKNMNQKDKRSNSHGK
jgi:5-methylcytosine-specific restriction endonuclease McrA